MIFYKYLEFKETGARRLRGAVLAEGMTNVRR